MNPLILYSGLGSLALGLALGWSVRDWKSDSDQLQAMESANRQREKLQEKVDALSLGYEADRSAADSNSMIRQTELRTIYRDVPINNDCAAPDSVRSLLQDGINEANARIAGKPVGSMPQTEPSSQPAQ